MIVERKTSIEHDDNDDLRHNEDGAITNSGTDNFFPRILMVCRSHTRKDKQTDYVGEYHLEWVQQCGGLPILIPRTRFTTTQVEHYLPMDGLLLVEAEDLSPEFLPSETIEAIKQLGEAAVNNIRQKHPSDVCYDHWKDRIEWRLLGHAMKHFIPILGICRGCQLVNVAYGGSLFYDILSEVPQAIPHINYENYDEYRHSLRIVAKTPLAKYYELDVGANAESTIQVNSFHHQGIKSLAARLSPMAFSNDDNVIEGFYDASNFNPEEGKFCLGIQFHPERLPYNTHNGAGLKVYQAFITAARNYGIKRRKAEPSSIT